MKLLTDVVMTRSKKDGDDLTEFSNERGDEVNEVHAPQAEEMVRMSDPIAIRAPGRRSSAVREWYT
jgi:hypothetical protein